MAKLVGIRYASALFDVGLSINKDKIFQEELDFLGKAFKDEPTLLQILGHPKINKEEKKNLIKDIFSGSLSQEMINFLWILIDKRREAEIVSIIDEYTKLFNDKNNIVNVRAITAVALDEPSKERLSANLRKTLNKEVKISNIVDKNVLGGVLLEMDNQVIDGTVKGQLENMKKAIR